MRWLLENIQVVIAVAGIIAYYLNQRARAKKGEAADFDGDGIPDNEPAHTEFDPATMELEEGERTRRLMEEMRRKRAEREGQPPVAPDSSAPAPMSVPARRIQAPPPVYHDPMAEMMKDFTRRLSPAPAPVPEPPQPAQQGEREILIRQIEMNERIRGLATDKVDNLRRASAITESEAVAYLEVPETRATSGNLVGDMRDPEAARRGILMAEIFGKPISMREGCMPRLN